MHGNWLRVTVAAFVATIGFGLVAPTISAQTTLPDTAVKLARAASAPKPITINDNYFKPKKVTVAVGAKVTWKWNGYSIHNVTVVKGPQKFASKNQSSGTFSRVIKKPGAYTIACTLHPGMEMTLKAT
jgi:plastocyanin